MVPLDGVGETSTPPQLRTGEQGAVALDGLGDTAGDVVRHLSVDVGPKDVDGLVFSAVAGCERDLAHGFLLD